MQTTTTVHGMPQCKLHSFSAQVHFHQYLNWPEYFCNHWLHGLIGKRQVWSNRAYTENVIAHHGDRSILKFTPVLQSAVVQSDLLNWRWKLNWGLTCRGSIWLPASGCPSVPTQLRSSCPESSRPHTELEAQIPHHLLHKYAPKRTTRWLYCHCALLLLICHGRDKVDMISNKVAVTIVFHHIAIFLWHNYNVAWMKSGFIITSQPPAYRVFVFPDSAIKTLLQWATHSHVSEQVKICSLEPETCDMIMAYHTIVIGN